MEKITINGTRYVVLDMEELYPFGGVKETFEEGEDCLVRKKLRY